eukprot:Skav224514  [mRNA]  locus=scaffold7649:2236:5612:- [translate_table: standard]
MIVSGRVPRTRAMEARLCSEGTKDSPLTHVFAGFVGAMITLLAILFSDSTLATSTTLAGLVVAILGLNTWRQQMEGKARFDACLDCYKAAIVWHRKLQGARSPLAWVHPKEGESSSEASRRQRDEVIQRTFDAWQAFYAASVGLEVFLQERARELTDAIWNIQADLQHTHWMSQEPGVPGDERQVQRAVLYQIPGRSTEFDRKIQAVMSKFDFAKCKTLDQLAVCGGVSADMLTAMCKKAVLSGAEGLLASLPPWRRVRLIRHRIPKRRPKNGLAYREVFEPSPRLVMDAYRTLKRRLSVFFEERVDGFPSSQAHGFLPDRSTRSNAQEHCESKFLIRLDIAGFFAAIDRACVQGLFESHGLDPNMAEVLASALVYEDKLVEGLPTSPLIANVVAHPIDVDMKAEVAESGDSTLVYTRYGDDISVSSRQGWPDDRIVKTVVERHGFSLRTEKTARSVPGQAHFVTGLSVNTSRPRVPKHLKRKLRLLAHYVDKRGLSDHAIARGISMENAANRLYGLLSYVHAVEPEVASKYREKIFRAFRAASVLPTYPGRAPILIQDVQLVIDESSTGDWTAVCVVEVPHLERARTEVREFLESLDADPFTLDRDQSLEAKGLHFVDNHPDIRTKWIERMAMMPLRAYVAYSRDRPSSDLYVELLRRIMFALRPWPRASSLTAHVEEGPITERAGELQSMLREAVPEGDTPRPVVVQAVRVVKVASDGFLLTDALSLTGDMEDRILVFLDGHLGAVRAVDGAAMNDGGAAFADALLVDSNPDC